MKGIITMFLLVLLASCNLKPNKYTRNDQCKSSYDTVLKMVVYSFVDRMPEYPGGQTELMKFITENINYPLEQDVYQGSINCTFIVDTDGKLIDVKIWNKEKGDYSLLEVEMIRVIKLMPKWSAGKCSDEEVPVRFNLPIKF